ncbi:MAG: adenylate/guanylate cyclase domain-containing protein [Dehalococcoidia bacterium]
MEPRIQYARTGDGANIAFMTLGEGAPPLVITPAGPISHLGLEWEVLENRAWLRALAAGRMVVQFDGRGSGLSDGDVGDLSLEAWVEDISAVVDELQLERFDLFAGLGFGPAGIAYAAQNPERVLHLVLWCTAAKGGGVLETPGSRALGLLMQTDWATYTEVIAHMSYGWSAGEAARKAAARYRETLDATKLRARYGAMVRMDAQPYLSQVRCPVLVQHRRQVQIVSVASARHLTAGLPNAHLNLLEGDTIASYMGDTESALRALLEFLGGPERGEAPGPEAEPGGFRTILFTDIEDSTALNERLGDAGARDVLRAHEQLVRDELKAHGGSEVKTMGDGFMASFPSATKAIECAIAIQRKTSLSNESSAEPLQVRIGLNAGEPIEEEQDLFGSSVILAARIASHGVGGEILTSNVVRELVAGKGFLFADRGDVVPKGFEDPVRVYEVRWRGEG